MAKWATNVKIWLLSGISTKKGVMSTNDLAMAFAEQQQMTRAIDEHYHFSLFGYELGKPHTVTTLPLEASMLKSVYDTYMEGYVYPCAVRAALTDPKIMNRNFVTKNYELRDIVTVVQYQLSLHKSYQLWAVSPLLFMNTVLHATNQIVIMAIYKRMVNPNECAIQFEERRSVPNVVMKRNIYKVKPEAYDPPPEQRFLYNEKFRCTKGEQYFKEGRLDFGTDDKEQHNDGSYRTVFGPSAAHNGVILADSDHNLKGGITRLTAARFPEEPGRHEELRMAQVDYITTPAISMFLRALQNQYSGHPDFVNYADARTYALQHHGDTHAKRLLRLASYIEIQEAGEEPSHLWLRSIKYKNKKDEIAKPGKPTRMIADLGVSASLQGFWLTKLLKQAMATQPIRFDGIEMEFIAKPTPKALTAAFTKLLNPPGRMYFCYFSDDACLGIRVGTEVQTYNIDISKCDASHTGQLFEALVQMTPEKAQDDMRVLVDQCKEPIVITSTCDKSKKVKLVPKEATLYSGSTITTVINNLANILIGFSIGCSEVLGPEDIHKAATVAGYVVTTELCEIPEDIQFLKYSPCRTTTGEYAPLLNLGVIIRASGTCRGDLPGKGDLAVRAQRFQSALLQGAYPRSHLPFIDAMEAAAGDTDEASMKVVRKMFEYKVFDQGPELYFETDSAYLRYRLNAADYSDMRTFSEMSVGDTYCGSIIDKILGKDYSLASALI
jgi:hypothetical protein